MQGTHVHGLSPRIGLTAAETTRSAGGGRGARVNARFEKRDVLR